MLDYDVVIVGGGPAGLAAGTQLSRSGRRTLLLERELYGGNLKNVDAILDYPDAGSGTGAELANRMAEEAQSSGLQMKEAEATEIEAFSSTRWVGCDGGKGYSTSVVIAATGSRFRKLGVPGEDEFLGRGVIDCVPCDGGLFRGLTVAVLGSGDHALSDALYLAGLAGRVIVLGLGPELTADPRLQERALAEPKLEVRHGVTVKAIRGTDRVQSVEVAAEGNGGVQSLPVDGVVVRVGTEPNSDLVADVVDLDGDGWIVTGEGLESSNRYVLAVGDVRSGSSGRIAAAVADGQAAARQAEQLLTQT
ncbi:MAG: FAD-dependent oxidoreductase [Candidatus Dormibacteraeota bacterium]|nr:FAD-dependent oxidoreductase [Candidatus Dormibacteraeota bacterium]